MSELVGDVAATAAKVASKGVFSALLGAFPWLPVAVMGLGLVGTLAGVGGTVWYRMQWLDCKAAGVQALIDQRAEDNRLNKAAVENLTIKLDKNQKDLNNAISVLASIPRNNACERDTGVRAVRDILCKKYPESEACSRPVPSR
jgi:hypothetical protein